MRRGLVSQLVGCALAVLAAGCAEVEEEQISSCLVEAVVVGRVEPGGQCRALGVVEGNSEDEITGMYERAYELLRRHSALRGGNFVVIDTVAEPHVTPRGTHETALVIRGRLFACATSYPPALVRAPRALPPLAPVSAQRSEAVRP